MVKTAFEPQPEGPSKQNQKYDEQLYGWLISWKEQTDSSINRIAQKLDRSGTAVSQYINRKYPGDIAGIEADIKRLRRKEEIFPPKRKSEIFR